MDVLAISGIVAAKYLIIPVQASKLDTAGMAALLDLAERVKRRMNPDVRIAAIIVGRTKGLSGFDARLLQSFRDEYPGVVVGSVRDSVKMREATASYQPITQYDPTGATSGDFRALAKEINAATAVLA